MSVKSVKPKVFTSIIVLIFMAAGALTYAVGAQAAEGAGASGDVAGVYEFQEQISKAESGLYAPSLDSMTQSELGRPLNLTVGSIASYGVSETLMHYVFAEQLGNGDVVVGGELERFGITCEAYTSECIAQVTADLTLIAAPPVWVNN